MSRILCIVVLLSLGLGPLATSDLVDARPKERRAPIELETGLLPNVKVATAARGRPSLKDRYIVVLADGAGDPLRVARAEETHGVKPTHVYRNVFKGFAAEIPPGRVEALKRDQKVLSVTPDQIVVITAQTTPTGVDRIDADLNGQAKIDGADERVDIDIAILDTGVGNHPDLNLYAVANCVPGTTADDFYGHGTAVAGAAAALDNGTGVVGVAPGARIWSVKMLGDQGFGSLGWTLCGLETVLSHAPGTGGDIGDIEVANASFTGPPQNVYYQQCSEIDHRPYCNLYAAGVTVVAAAGNRAVSTFMSVPADFAEVITVSGLADSDGKAGGLGPATSAGADDAFYRDLAFQVNQNGAGSNWGAAIDLAAPAVDILTTVLTTPGAPISHPSGYKRVTGTSIATPQVAGAAALYIVKHGRVGPGTVMAGLISEGEPSALTDDPDGIAEPIVNVASPDFDPPTVAITAPLPNARVKAGAAIKLTATDVGGWGVKSVEVRYCKGPLCDFATAKRIGIATRAPYVVKWKKPPKNGTYTLVAMATDKAGNVRISAPITVRVKN